MDITPIYELRERLRAAAIAGTNLLSEDFRLQRALEAAEPLGAVSPVFAKIVALVKELLAPGQDEREGVLLDTITLVDALLCTQGQVAVSDDIMPMELKGVGGILNNASYSEVKGLSDALTNSGGGRYSYLQEMHEKKPELFEDYRIIPALVQALGTSYSELASEAQRWLEQMGEKIIPLLKEGFDPKGKKEMLRRVELIDGIAGGSSNAFYLENLPASEKEIRQALIYALRHSPENEDTLLGLTRTEKGKAKKMAYYALACQEGDEAKACLEKLLLKKPEEAMAALSVSKTSWASDMVVSGVNSMLDELEKKLAEKCKAEDKKKDIFDILNRLIRYMEALTGKDGGAVSGCCRRAAAVAEMPEMLKLKLDFVYNDELEIYQGKIKGQNLKKIIGRMLSDYLAACADGEMLSLADELYNNYGKTQCGEEYLAAAVTARLISCEDSTEWLSRELDGERKDILASGFERALDGLFWDSNKERWMLELTLYNPFIGISSENTYEVKQQIKGGFTKLIMKISDARHGSWGLDKVLGHCIPDNDAEYEKLIMEYFYRRVLEGADNADSYCNMLKKHGFNRCEGLAVGCFRSIYKKRGGFDTWDVRSFLINMPGSSEAVKAEGRELIRLIENGEFGKKLSNLNTKAIESYLEYL